MAACVVASLAAVAAFVPPTVSINTVGAPAARSAVNMAADGHHALSRPLLGALCAAVISVSPVLAVSGGGKDFSGQSLEEQDFSGAPHAICLRSRRTPLIPPPNMNRQASM